MFPAMAKIELKMLLQTRYAATHVTVPFVPSAQKRDTHFLVRLEILHYNETT